MAAFTIDPLLMADLSATCNSLGYLDDATGKYQKEPECIECVKDLVRFLRRDDENHEIRRALGETKVVVKDLIPIIKHHSNDTELLDVTLRLLVNLTTPALILYEEELPGERVSRRFYLEVIQYLQSYKEAFSDKVFWSVLAAKMTSLLEKDWEHRMEDDRLMIERVLILVRNVLNIPANPAAEKRTDDDASVHDQVLWGMHLAGLDDIILFIAQSDDEQHLCIHILEVVSLMLREQDAKQLARSGAARSHQEREKDIQELEQLRRLEQEAKRSQMRKLASVRHTRFGGTFTVKNITSISDRDLIYHRPLAQINELSFDKEKVPRKTPKNRQPLADGETTRRSMLTIRLFLKQFCAELLTGAYNKLMYNVKDDLARAKAQAHDESYYMWAVKFFMEFNRHHHFRVDRISETLSVSMFHYIQTQLESHLEMMTAEKRKIKIWSKRAHLALRAYQELLFTIQHMDASADDACREASRVLKSNLFYMPEYRELLYVLLCQYSPVKMSRKFLTDLVETTHVFIKLLEKFSGGGRIVVKQKRKAKKKSRGRRPGTLLLDRLTFAPLPTVL
ncbi:protein timeless homolog [Pollicipes pollicipes]|uniref:protein timeless homolog n=1 Tax=Pollicipes pollicipes TaxID=41117 RepID=UPI001884EF90|nr:protein timeless homolog [Pollicipes pollicipes]